MADYWVYRGYATNVVDGDTLDVVVDLGFGVQKNIRVRLLFIDTSEIYGTKKESEEYKTGMEQKEFVEDWVTSDREWPLNIRTHQDTGKYGRWLAEIERRKDMEDLGEAILEKWPEAEYDY